jgi:hypothetical protein
MFILRWLSLVLVVLAVMLMGADLVSSLEKGGAIFLRSFAQVLMLFGADSLTWVQGNLPQPLAGACETVLSWPGWLVIGVPGGVLAALLPNPEKKPRPSEPPPYHL